MIPVKQDRLYADDGIGNGNCLAACFASLLELPLWMVPPFDQMFGRSDWAARVNEYLARMHRLRCVRTGGHDVAAMPEFYIASGPSPRASGISHAVTSSTAAATWCTTRTGVTPGSWASTTHGTWLPLQKERSEWASTPK